MRGEHPVDNASIKDPGSLHLNDPAWRLMPGSAQAGAAQIIARLVAQRVVMPFSPHVGVAQMTARLMAQRAVAPFAKR
jgi:hypothetical protein